MKAIGLRFWLAASVCLNLTLLASLTNTLAVESSVVDACGPGTTLDWALGFAESSTREVLDVGCIDESGRRHGVALRLVEGKPISLAGFDHGIQEGPTVLFGGAGTVEMIGQTVGGKANGTTVMFDAQGRPLSAFTIDRELDRASHITWYPGGAQRSRYHTTVDTESGLPTAVLVGPYSFRDEEGSVLATGQYDDGVRTGSWQCRSQSTEGFVSATSPGGRSEPDLIECLNELHQPIREEFRRAGVAVSGTQP